MNILNINGTHGCSTTGDIHLKESCGILGSSKSKFCREGGKLGQDLTLQSWGRLPFLGNLLVASFQQNGCCCDKILDETRFKKKECFGSPLNGTVHYIREDMVAGTWGSCHEFGVTMRLCHSLSSFTQSRTCRFTWNGVTHIQCGSSQLNLSGNILTDTARDKSPKGLLNPIKLTIKMELETPPSLTKMEKKVTPGSLFQHPPSSSTPLFLLLHSWWNMHSHDTPLVPCSCSCQSFFP